MGIFLPVCEVYLYFLFQRLLTLSLSLSLSYYIIFP